MQSGLLSLDPPAAPALLSTPLANAWSYVEQYGWFVLIGFTLVYFARQQYMEWSLRRARNSYVPDAAHVEETTMRVRQARLQQQAAWAATAPSMHRATKQQSEEEKRLQRVYGESKHDSVEDDSKLSMQEVFGSEFYTAAKKRKGGGRDDSSSSSSSSSGSSGFKPYIKPAPGGGGSRRFGGGGGPKKGG